MHPPFLVLISWTVKKTEPISAHPVKRDFLILKEELLADITRI
jgi:hypothetical protein